MGKQETVLRQDFFSCSLGSEDMMLMIQWMNNCNDCNSVDDCGNDFVDGSDLR